MKRKLKVSFFFFAILTAIFSGLFFHGKTANAQQADLNITTGEAEAVYQETYLPIVRCGGPNQPACTFCDLFSLLQRLINFILFRILIPIAALMMAAGGITLLVSRGNEEVLKKGKAILTSTVIGIFITYTSWLIVNTVLTVIGFQLPFSNMSVVPRWNALPINCRPQQAESPPAQPTQPASTRPPATALPPGVLEVPPSRFSTTPDERSCSGFNALTNYNEIIINGPITICSTGCDCRQRNNITANPSILRSIQELNRTNINFVVTSISTGIHTSDASTHYQGNAVDITLPREERSPANFSQLQTQLRNINPNDRNTIFCEAGGRRDDNCGAGTNHIHATFRR